LWPSLLMSVFLYRVLLVLFRIFVVVEEGNAVVVAVFCLLLLVVVVVVVQLVFVARRVQVPKEFQI